MNDWAEFRHFKYLLAIVENRGFRAAAEQLHTAQPNLSAQAKQFQEQSAIHLFRKSKDGRIKLTETGVAFRPIAQGLLDARDEAIAAWLPLTVGGKNPKVRLCFSRRPSALLQVLSDAQGNCA
jgi:DNA-binding transcriptional LysR family regulator